MAKVMLSEHFSEGEFACKDGCGIVNVDPILLLKLEKLRAMLGRPLSINSGCRCKKYNLAVGGEPGSKHLTTARKACQAADIHCPTDSDRYLILSQVFNIGFTGVGVADSYVHVDVRSETPVCWTY